MRILGSHKVLGAAFIVLLLLAVWLTYAIFSKKFTDYEEVTLHTSTVGLQLPERADVKVRGVIVGEVLETKASTTEGAELTLGIYPDKIESVPANVTGSIVPKTLFGEKYVSLVIPETGAEGVIAAGATIDRTVVSTELEKVLSDIYPLLQAVRPADLNLTLTALATALEGRGEQLGENLETVDSYLKRINPQIPALVQDLRLTAEVSQTYADILPEVAQILDNTVKTTQTIESREAVLRSALRDIRSFSDTARVFLDANDDRLERFGEISTQTLAVLSRYSPVIPCLAKGLVNFAPRAAEAFRGYELHIVLETLPHQPRSYNVNDRPVFNDDRGPNCYRLPNPPWSQENPLVHVPDFNDGVDEPTGKGTSRVAPGLDLGSDPAGYHGDPTDVDLLRQFLADSYGVDADSGLGVLLGGPLVADGGGR
ncbi:phospholipid/cholesterol/gamma-HCH transport system substrate-binding protein [Nocardioides thalensis]|uniref:Phospholipid/cholesterol/gamma-HCH transport system substrate-binding protein n=1 Tax=Nocardioides thalensis TaxID=1914755 RepID=A0A853BV29_9ACTN|nr:MCE family protein [Nocardioides thalensis]NYI99719.1 phospholipid/cholesterol/gamma-HCH transport system substrate-binding protein [Nocardioides thalensis]